MEGDDCEVFYTTTEKNLSEVLNMIRAHHLDLVEIEINGGGIKGRSPYYMYVLFA